MVRCPGDGLCDIWDATGGDYEEKKNVCLDCRDCRGNPPLEPGKRSEVNELEKNQVIFSIEKLVRRQNAGRSIDWDEVDLLEQKLFEVYRDEELRRERIFRIQTQKIFEAMIQS